MPLLMAILTINDRGKMLTYIYDGTFQGFLSSIHEGMAKNEIPDRIVIEEKNEPELFSEYVHIISNQKKSENLLSFIKNKFDHEAVRDMYYSFLSDRYDIEKDVFDYIMLSIKSERKIDGNYSNDLVRRIQKVVRQVLCEKHKFIGITRFKHLKDGIYYAPIEPDNNITCLLINHFKKRFSEQRWLIHDTKRDIGAYYDLEKTILIKIGSYDERLSSVNDESQIYHEDEIKFQDLWKTYFNNISIKERKNPKLQRQFIPLRYWKHLIEKN
jgi:probable DNA metabolism protein